MGRQIVMRPEMLHLKRLRSKWASASSTGRLTFNTDLLRESSDFRIEAIIHELLHLKVPNHGKVFRALLKAHLAER
jgi:predicted metal-dependent hydrolase